MQLKRTKTVHKGISENLAINVLSESHHGISWDFKIRSDVMFCYVR